MPEFAYIMWARGPNPVCLGQKPEIAENLRLAQATFPIELPAILTNSGDDTEAGNLVPIVYTLVQVICRARKRATPLSWSESPARAPRQNLRVPAPRGCRRGRLAMCRPGRRRTCGHQDG